MPYPMVTTIRGAAQQPGGGAGGEWTPSDLTGIAAWWDGGTPATLFEDDAGTDPVDVDGDFVKHAEDRSGNGNDAIQTGTTTIAPRYRVNIQNGLSALQGDGGDRLDHPVLASDPTALTIFFAGKRNAAATAHVVWGHRSEATRLMQVTWQDDTTAIFQLRSSGNSLKTVTKSSVAVTNAHILVAQFNKTGNLHRLWFNGGTPASDASDFGSETFTSTLNTLMATFSGSSYITQVDGYLFEAFISTSAVSLAEINEGIGYLASRWDISTTEAQAS